MSAEKILEANPILTAEELAEKLKIPVARIKMMLAEGQKHRHTLTYLWVGDGVFAKCSTCDFEGKVPWDLQSQDDLKLLFHGPG